MTFNKLSIKVPFHSDLEGKSGKIYAFWSYSFEDGLSEDAKGIKGLFYIAKIENNSISERYSLNIIDDIFLIQEKFINQIPNAEDYSFLIYEGSDDLNEVLNDIESNLKLNFKNL